MAANTYVKITLSDIIDFAQTLFDEFGTGEVLTIGAEYVMRLDELGIKIYTSVSTNTGGGRAVGRDAIRVVGLVDGKWRKTNKVLRVAGWQGRVIERIKGLLALRTPRFCRVCGSEEVTTRSGDPSLCVHHADYDGDSVVAGYFGV